MKKKTIIFGFLLCINLIHSSIASASVKPIIISKNDPVITSYSHTIFLSWYINDDNPKMFLIYENNQILQTNISITSNIITYNFSSVTGTFNITLVVYEYSNNIASSSVQIIIPEVTYLSAITNQNQTTAQSSKHNATLISATPGFTYEIILSSIIGFALITLLHRHLKQRR